MIAERARASRRQRMRWGAAMLWGGLILVALHLRPLAPQPQAMTGYILRLAPGADGPIVFNANDLSHEAYPRNVGVVKTEVHLGRPVWRAGSRVLVIENTFELTVWKHPGAEWPWPDQSPDDIAELLRESIIGMLKLPTSNLEPGWWDTPQRTILWREIALAAASWLGWPVLALGFYLVVRPSQPERICARLRRSACPRCRYDLRGGPDRCPECGRPLTPDEQALIPI